MTSRADQIARNEALYRDVNERVRDVRAAIPASPELVEFLCECGDRNCAETIPVTPEEYEGARGDPKRFLLLPGHQAEDVETVVAAVEGRFVIVEKHDEEATIARKRDPRRL
ncbi:MAG: hypothetical protein M3312_03355 [Actinomycetota bacterium]|nr:hypothetical protein [Actinomycetota bacterium]